MRRIVFLLSIVLLVLLAACLPTETVPEVYVEATHEGTEFTLQQASPAELNSRIESIQATDKREFTAEAPMNDNEYTLRVEDAVITLIFHGVEGDEVVFSYETQGEFPRGYRFIVSHEEIGPFAVLLFKIPDPERP